MWIRASDLMEWWWRPRVTFKKPAAGTGLAGLECTAMHCGIDPRIGGTGQSRIGRELMNTSLENYVAFKSNI
jgi:hypothetical protein